MKKSKILIIGKNGQLAQALLSQARLFDFTDISAFDRTELDVLDLGKLTHTISTLKPDIVINTSALQVMLQCESNPSEAFHINFLAVRNLAALCKAQQSLLVTFSTDYVFAGADNKLNSETDPTKPLQIYGLSKLAGEYAALYHYPEGVYVIRTCGLYGGLAGSPAKGNFVLNILLESEEDKPLIEVSSEQVVSPTYAPDLATAVFALLRSGAQRGLYHLVNEGSCSWYEFTREIFNLAGVTKELRPINRGGHSGNANRPAFSALANTKAKALGITLPSWQDGLKAYIEFLKASGVLKN